MLTFLKQFDVQLLGFAVAALRREDFGRVTPFLRLLGVKRTDAAAGRDIDGVGKVRRGARRPRIECCRAFWADTGPTADAIRRKRKMNVSIALAGRGIIWETIGRKPPGA